jgi:hypothetical protein
MHYYPILSRLSYSIQNSREIVYMSINCPRRERGGAKGGESNIRNDVKRCKRKSL